VVAGIDVIRAYTTAAYGLAAGARQILLTGTVEEDLACADYLAALLHGETPEPTPYLERSRRSETAQIFFNPAKLDFPAADMDCCLHLDRFDFALWIERRNGLLVMQAG
jgi:2-phosphosulfolactate phosphatase